MSKEAALDDRPKQLAAGQLPGTSLSIGQPELGIFRPAQGLRPPLRLDLRPQDIVGT